MPDDLVERWSERVVEELRREVVKTDWLYSTLIALVMEGGGEWVGTPSDLLCELERRAGAKHRGEVPRSTSTLGKRVFTLAPLLERYASIRFTRVAWPPLYTLTMEGGE